MFYCLVDTKLPWQSNALETLAFWRLICNLESVKCFINKVTVLWELCPKFSASWMDDADSSCEILKTWWKTRDLCFAFEFLCDVIRTFDLRLMTLPADFLSRQFVNNYTAEQTGQIVLFKTVCAHVISGLWLCAHELLISSQCCGCSFPSTYWQKLRGCRSAK